MTVFVLSFAVIVLAMLGLAAGVLLGRGPIAGSCGGLGQGNACAACTSPCSKRRRARAPSPSREAS
jgi:hypothetical protein